MLKKLKIYSNIKLFLYVIKKAYLNRLELQSFLYQKEKNRKCITDIDLNSIEKSGIKSLVLDFDGVISPHDHYIPSKSITIWLKKAIKIFGSGKIFILSNNSKNADRIKYFNKNFKEIIFIKNRYMKPYPYDICNVLKKNNIKTFKSIMIIDDRLLTGILLSLIIKTEAIFITSPLVDTKNNIIKETYMSYLRKIDKIICKTFFLFPDKI